MDYRQAYEDLEKKYNDLNKLYNQVCEMANVITLVCAEPNCGSTFIGSENGDGDYIGDASIHSCTQCNSVHACLNHLSRHLKKSKNEKGVFGYLFCRNCMPTRN
jgi:hypothetical protein